MHRLRAAEHPRPDYVLLHISDTHLIGGDRRLYGAVDADDRLGELLEQLNQSGLRPDAIVFTGDLADKGEPAAYRKLRGLVEPFAAQLGAELVWVMGNHDDRAELRKFLLDEAPSMAPLDRVCMIDGLRIIVLDTSVPGHHHGEIRASQLGWLAEELATPAPDGTILALHHPPIPSVWIWPSRWSCATRLRLGECCGALTFAPFWPGTCTTRRMPPSSGSQCRLPRRLATPRT